MSSAAVNRLVNFLVMECEDGGASPPTKFTDDLLVLAKAEILSGNGSVGFLQSSSGNGKTVTQAESLTCDEVAYACRMALRLYNDDAGGSPVTFPVFSQM